MSSRSCGPPARADPSGSASISSRITGSAMNPALITSARPLAYSSPGSDASTAGSASTPAGGWNAPTRFLPSAMLMAVLPPTAASTTASSVVGTSTSGTPRSQVAAVNPARSVAAPPPTPTIASRRPSRCAASRDHSLAATAMALAASPSGICSAPTTYPPSRQPLLEQLPEPRARVADQQRPRRVHAHPLGRRGEPGRQVDDRQPGQQPLRPGVQYGAAAQGDHMAAKNDRPGHGLALQRAERRLPVLDEDVADRLARRRLDLRVGLHEAGPEPGRE